MTTYIDKSLAFSAGRPPQMKTRGIIQQHGFVTPNSLFDEYLDRDRVRMLSGYDRAVLGERLPLKEHHPASAMEREFLVPLGHLQEKYSHPLDLRRVPGGVIREGLQEADPTPEDAEYDRSMAAMRARIAGIIADDTKAFEGEEQTPQRKQPRQTMYN